MVRRRAMAPPNVDVAHLLVRQKVRAGIGQNDAPCIEDVAAAAEGERLPCALLNHQHGHTGLRKLAHLVEDLICKCRGERRRGLVEQDQAWR